MVVLAGVLMVAPAAISFAQTSATSSTPPPPTSYTLLAPLPTQVPGYEDFNTTGYPVSINGISGYVSDMLEIIYGLATVLAVIVIIIGGLQYMSTDAISGKQDGKRRIEDALWGLLLILCSWIILHTINPNLVNLNLLINDVNNAQQQNLTTSNSSTSTPTTPLPAETNFALTYTINGGNPQTKVFPGTDAVSSGCTAAANILPIANPTSTVTITANCTPTNNTI